MQPKSNTASCLTCGKPLARKTRKRCAICSGTAGKTLTLTDEMRAGRFKFWRNVDKTESCWFWLGPFDARGYGSFGHNYRQYRTHRFAYALEHGEVPAGFYVCHTCDNPACVNPAHLWLGTADDNNKDCSAKGRFHGLDRKRGAERKKTSHRGTAHYLSPFTEEQVKDIRSRDLSAWGSKTRLCKEFGVSPATIRNILQGRTHQD